MNPKDRQREKISILSNILGQEPMFDGSFLDVPKEVRALTDKDLVDVSHLGNLVRFSTEQEGLKMDVKVHQDVAPDVEALFAAAKEAGFDFKLNSGFRNVAHQRAEYLSDTDEAFIKKESQLEEGDIGWNPKTIEVKRLDIQSIILVKL